VVVATGPSLTVVQATGEGELRRQPVSRRYHPGLELAGMSLHLIAVLVDAAEKVGAPMHVQHDAVALCDVQLLACIVVLAHLNPFGTQDGAVSSPLPPVLPADSRNASWSQLRADELGRSR
jgi:hypothetical protein